MGTDIHCFVEQKMYRFSRNDIDHTGKWISIDKWTKSRWAILYPERDEAPTWEVERKDMVYTDRNYALFAILANQRNSENMPYISDPRGLPEDVSPEIPLQIKYSEVHSTTWFTAIELLEYNWNQVFEYEDETIDGEKCIGSVNYKECGHVFLEVINQLVGKKNPADFRFIFTFDN